MRKVMVFLKRRSDLDRTAFFDWWLNRHRPLAANIPGLRHYTISLEADGEDTLFDGLAELWFDHVQAADTGFASPQGQTAMADARDHVSRRERLDLHEHKFVNTGLPAPFKLMAALKRHPDLTRAAFKSWWLDKHAPLVVAFPELRRYQVDLVEDGPEGFADGIAEVSFADLETLKRITSSKQVKDAQEDSRLHSAARYRMFVEEHPVF
jgi:uncharacterized protein (TIGR02118 family)